MARNTHHMEKRGSVWYFRATWKGKHYHERLSKDINTAIELRDDYLYELRKHNVIISNRPGIKAFGSGENQLFGEVAQLWSQKREIDIRQKQLKKSSMRDYRSIMNHHILPYFGNQVIVDITAADVDDFIGTLTCSPKRINNILVPVRSLFKMAKKRKLVTENVMLDVENLKTEQPDIFPLNQEEVSNFLDNVGVNYKSFFLVAFYTGMRFGEMAALKWENVDSGNKQIHIKESRVYGVEGPPKTKGSKRIVDMLPPVIKALEKQRQLTGKGIYVFRDIKGRLMETDHIRNHVWKPTLIKAQLDYRPMIQTRHTFATIAIDSGEDVGWVQQMMGHSSLQMIYTRYYGWIKKRTRNDGSAFTASFESDKFNEEDMPKSKVKIIKLVPKMYQTQKKDLQPKAISP